MVISMTVRALLMIPIGAVIAVLMLTVVGIPLGFALGLAVGAFVSKPLRKHPLFNPKGDS